MKNHFILTIACLLLFSVLGHSQNKEIQPTEKTTIETKEPAQVNLHRFATQKKFGEFSKKEKSLFGGSQSGIYFPKNNTGTVDVSDKFKNQYSFYTPTSGYTTIIQKGKKVKGANLSNIVSHGLNLWLKSN